GSGHDCSESLGCSVFVDGLAGRENTRVVGLGPNCLAVGRNSTCICGSAALPSATNAEGLYARNALMNPSCMIRLIDGRTNTATAANGATITCARISPS